MKRAGVGLGLLVAMIVSCSRRPSDGPASAGLWGDVKPVVSVKELMKYMIDPVADNIFNAVGTTVTRHGVVEIEPKTEEDWDRIRIGAVSLAEGAYLLKIRRPFTPPGDDNNSAGPDAVELSPAQITAKVERDPVEWNARIEALRNVALEALDVVQRERTSTSCGTSARISTRRVKRVIAATGTRAKARSSIGSSQRRLEEFRARSPRGNTGATPQKQ